MAYNEKEVIFSDQMANLLQFGASKKIWRTGGCFVLSIPIALFKQKTWIATDKIKMQIINQDTIIIHNPEASERVKAKQKLMDALL